MTVCDAKICFALLIFFLAPSLSFSSALAAGSGAPITVAVASNYARPLEDIRKQYEKEFGLQIQVTIASSGTLYAQIAKGAPYDLFLSADSDLPSQLHSSGHCFAPFEYARGHAVLWSKKESLMGKSDWLEVIRNKQARRIAIANPRLAPYGMVLMPVLEEWFSEEEQRSKLVYGQNVAQAFQYAASGSVDAAFTSLSFAMSPEGAAGRYWEISDAKEVNQWGCITSSTNKFEPAKHFVLVLQSPQVKKILKTYGYQ